MTDVSQKSIIDIIKFIVYFVVLAVTVTIAYGAIDARVTVIETDIKYKIDNRELYERLNTLEEKIFKKIELEVSKVKK